MRRTRDPRHHAASSVRLRSNERGASEAFMLILLASLVGFAGIAYDTGMAFNARREATNIAGSAARAGANSVSTDSLYENSFTPVLGIDAIGVALAAADTAGADRAEARIESDTEIWVKVERSHTNVFLGLVGIGDYVVHGEATAKVESAVD